MKTKKTLSAVLCAAVLGLLLYAAPATATEEEEVTVSYTEGLAVEKGTVKYTLPQESTVVESQGIDQTEGGKRPECGLRVSENSFVILKFNRGAGNKPASAKLNIRGWGPNGAMTYVYDYPVGIPADADGRSAVVTYLNSETKTELGNIRTGYNKWDVRDESIPLDTDKLTVAEDGTVYILLANPSHAGGMDVQDNSTPSNTPTLTYTSKKKPSANLAKANFTVTGDNTGYMEEEGVLTDGISSVYGYKATLTLEEGTSYSTVKAYVKAADEEKSDTKAFSTTTLTGPGSFDFYVVVNKALDTSVSKVYCE